MEQHPENIPSSRRGQKLDCDLIRKQALADLDDWLTHLINNAELCRGEDAAVVEILNLDGFVELEKVGLFQLLSRAVIRIANRRLKEVRFVYRDPATKHEVAYADVTLDELEALHMLDDQHEKVYNNPSTSLSGRRANRSPTGNTGANRSPKKGEPMTPQWRPRLGSYSRTEKRAIKFRSKEAMDPLIDLCFSDPKLIGMPFHFADGKTIIVPKEAVSLLKSKGFVFQASELQDPEELTPEELAEMQEQHSL